MPNIQYTARTRYIRLATSFLFDVCSTNKTTIRIGDGFREITIHLYAIGMQFLFEELERRSLRNDSWSISVGDLTFKEKSETSSKLLQNFSHIVYCIIFLTVLKFLCHIKLLFVETPLYNIVEM